MSHMVKAPVEIKNERCLLAAITALGFENLGRKTHKLFSSQTAEGIGVKLPGWNYPAVINPERGEVHYDNYGESWGKQIEMDKLFQRYTFEVANEQAVANGYMVEQTVLPNGDMEVLMTQVASS